MRLFSSSATLGSVALLCAGTDCSSDANNDDCSCPSYPQSPQVAIELPCGTPARPTVALSGVCAGSEEEQDDRLVFGSNTAGTCHVALTFANGSTYAKDVEFSQGWLPCGSDPHGCGSYVVATGLPEEGPFQELVTGASCADAGVSVGSLDAGGE